MNALEIARTTMLDALPPNSPLPGQIKAARFTKKSEITADLIMFDGLSAQARFTKWALGWSSGWNDLTGGDISLENGEWARVERDEVKP